MKIELVAPAERYRETFLRGLRELQQEGLPWYLGADVADVDTDFAAYVARKLGEVTSLVPKTQLWAIADEHFVGRIGIHHVLNDALRESGGHIGYDTVPSFRGRGVAKEMLRLALPVARGLGLPEVLLTCDDTNAASIRVIGGNGGVLRETRELDASRPRKRYYVIALT